MSAPSTSRPSACAPRRPESPRRRRCVDAAWAPLLIVALPRRVDMINKHVLPSAKAAELPQVAALEAALDTLGKAIEEIHASSGKPQADLARTLRLETMIDIREVCDAAEGLCPADLWTSRPTRTCSSSTRPRTSTRTTSLRAALARCSRTTRSQIPSPHYPLPSSRTRPDGVVYIDAKDYLSISTRRTRTRRPGSALRLSLVTSLVSYSR